MVSVQEYKQRKSQKKQLLEMFLEYPEMFYKEDMPVIEKRLGEDSTEEYPKLVATIGNKLVGFISCAKPWDSENIWFLSWFAVKREQQGQGIGSLLLKEIEKRVAKSTTPHMYIYTSGSANPVNQKTHAFYLKSGYKVVGKIPKFYSQHEDKVIYYKELSQKK